MTAQEIIKRARSIADVPNSKYITYDDEKNSLFESYKDMYAKITDSSDDYYVDTAIFNTTNAVRVGEWEYELDLTGYEIYKLRFVNYNMSGNWQTMQKFNTASRNTCPSLPQYRWKGTKLWIIAGVLPTQIRIDYYPPPKKPSLPDYSYNYAVSQPQYYRTNVSAPQYFSVLNPNLADQTDYLAYAYNGTALVLESVSQNSSKTIFTAASNITKIQYNAGYIYFLSGGNIYRATTDYSSTLVPVALTSTADITDFSVSQNKIFYSNATESHSSELDGTSDVVLYAFPTVGLCQLDSGSKVYIKAGELYVADVATAIPASMCGTDGVYIYFLQNSVLHKYVANEDYVLKTNVSYIGTPYEGFVSTVDKKYNVQAISTAEDTVFDYPLNAAYELMAYQCAIDFKSKNNGDPTALQTRLVEIAERFIDQLRRDEYLPERMQPAAPQNYYW